MPHEVRLSGPSTPNAGFETSTSRASLPPFGRVRAAALAATVLGVGGFALCHAWPSVFRATASILAVAAPGSPRVSQPPPVAGLALLHEVAREQHLADEPGFGLARAAPLGLILPAGLSGARDDAETREARAVSALNGRLSIERYGSTSLSDIAVTAEDAALATRLADAVARRLTADPPSPPLGNEPGPPTGAPMPAVPLDAAPESRPADIGDGGAALERAEAALRDASTRARELQHMVAAGRVLDPLPDGLPWPALDGLRARYAEAVQREAGYRATLGEKHPVLIGAGQQVAELRRELATELRRAAGVAVKAVERARAEQAEAERQIRIGAELAAASARRDPIVTGSIAPPGRRATTDVGGPEPRTGVRYELTTPASVRIVDQGRWMAEAGFGALAAFGCAGLYGTRRRRERALRREPEMGEPESPLAGLPILARVPGAATPSLGDGLEYPPSAAFAPALRAIRDTLLDDPRIAGRDGPTMLLVCSLDGDAGVAVGLARAAAEAGGRTLLVEVTGGSSLFQALVAPGTEPALVETGTTTRLLYELAPRDPALFLIPLHPDEVRAKRRAATRARTQWHRQLPDFETVVMAASGTGGEVSELAGTATAIILVARPDHDPAAIEAAHVALSSAAPWAIVLAEAPDFAPFRQAA